MDAVFLKANVLSLLWEDHQSKEQKYISEPSLVINYTRAIKRFVRKRAKSIKNLGEDPNSYPYVDAFQEEWTKKLKRDMGLIWDKKLNYLLSCSSSPYSSSELYNKILEEIDEKTVLNNRLSSPSSSSSSSQSPAKYSRTKTKTRSNKRQSWVRHYSSDSSNSDNSRSRSRQRRRPSKRAKYSSGYKSSSSCSSESSHSSSYSSSDRSQSSDRTSYEHKPFKKDFATSSSPKKTKKELKFLYEIKKNIIDELDKDKHDRASSSLMKNSLKNLKIEEETPLEEDEQSIKVYDKPEIVKEEKLSETLKEEKIGKSSESTKRPLQFDLEDLIPQDVKCISPKKASYEQAHNLNNIDDVISKLLQKDHEASQDQPEIDPISDMENCQDQDHSNDILCAQASLKVESHSNQEYAETEMPYAQKYFKAEIPLSQPQYSTEIPSSSNEYRKHLPSNSIESHVSRNQNIAMSLFSALSFSKEELGSLAFLGQCLQRSLSKAIQNSNTSELFSNEDFILGINLIQDKLSCISLSSPNCDLKDRIATLKVFLRMYSIDNIPQFLYGIDLKALYKSTRYQSTEEKILFIKTLLKYENVEDSVLVMEDILERLKTFEK